MTNQSFDSRWQIFYLKRKLWPLCWGRCWGCCCGRGDGVVCHCLLDYMLCYVMLFIYTYQCYVMLCYLFIYAGLHVMLCYVMLFIRINVMLCYVMLFIYTHECVYVMLCYLFIDTYECYVMLCYVTLCYVIYLYV